jgi:hypothetical protein
VIRLRVVVPVDFEDTAIPIPVMINYKRASCLAGIIANGRALKPLIIIPHNSVETDLYECEFTPDMHHILFQEHGLLTREIFAEWTEAVFFPDTIRMRQSLDYAGRLFLIPDGFAGHLSYVVEERCLFQGVMLIVIPPHTSDQVQPLDLALFAVLKLERDRVHPLINLNTQTVKILKILCGFQNVSTPLNIIKAFRWASLVS